MGEDHKTVKVACTMERGLTLQHVRPIADESGIKQMRRVGPKVTLNGPTLDGKPGLTDVDADWWAEWATQNEKSDLVANRTVFEVKEDAAQGE